MARACNQAIPRSDTVAFTPSEHDGRGGFFCALIPSKRLPWTISARDVRRGAHGR